MCYFVYSIGQFFVFLLWSNALYFEEYTCFLIKFLVKGFIFLSLDLSFNFMNDEEENKREI